MRKLLFLLLLLPPALAAQQVPVWKLPTLQSRLAGAGDTLLIVNFWATWCKPCVEEMPYFEQINQTYAARGVKVLFVSLDFASRQKAVAAFVKNKGIRSEVVLLDEPDYNAWLDKISPDWQGSIPATLLLLPARSFRSFKEQSFTYAGLESWIKEALE